MTTYFCDARNGNDASDGLSWANAKKTLGGLLSVMTVNDDDANCVGVFKEVFVLTSAVRRTFNAVGFAYLEGDGVLARGIQETGGQQRQIFNGFIFRDHTTAGVERTGGGSGKLEFVDCVFENEVEGGNTGASATMDFTRCIFRNCTTGFEYSGSGQSGSVGWLFRNCTFVNNTNGIKGVNTAAGVPFLNVQNCIFSHNTVHMDMNKADNYVKDVSNYNNIDFASGKCVVNSVDQTSLAQWTTTVSPQDSKTISVDPVYVDRLKRLHGLKPSSPCLVAGSTAFGTLIQGAIQKQCSGVSTNENSSEWTGATLVDVVINGNGDLELAAGKTVGTATIVHDFGASRDVSRLYVEYDPDAPAAIIDFDKSDTLPETWQVRVADSDDGIVFSAFTIVDLMRPVLSITGKRYVKVELTLRKDA